MTDAATLTVHRVSTRDEGERLLFVSVDGEQLGQLRYGRRLSRSLAPGPHRLRIHNTFWWKTVAFDTRPGEDVHYGAINVVPAAMVGLAATLGAAPMFVKIERLTGDPAGADPPSAETGATRS